MASKPKRPSRKKQLFSELNALIADDAEIALDPKSLKSSTLPSSIVSLEDEKPGLEEREVIVFNCSSADSSTSMPVPF